MVDFLKKDDLVSVKQLNELLKKFNKKDSDEKKVSKWIIIGVVVLSVAVIGALVYKFFIAKDDEFDDYDDDFDDLDYDDDYDDFDDDFDDDFEDDDFDDEDYDDEDIEDDFEETSDDEDFETSEDVDK